MHTGIVREEMDQRRERRISAMSVQDEQRTRIYRKQERASSEPQTISIFASVRAYIPAVLIT